MDETIKTCPFCKGEAVYSSVSGHRIGCKDRSCFGSIGLNDAIFFDTKEEAISMWNKRVSCEEDSDK